MPFVAHELRSTRGVVPRFVERAAERRFFYEQVLAPDEPAVHLLSVSGPPGVGTSTLLARWREDAQTAPVPRQCDRRSISNNSCSRQWSHTHWGLAVGVGAAQKMKGACHEM